MKSAHVLVWFRRNLRLHDNAALNAAVASGLPIACVWVSQRPSENHNPRQSLFHYQAAQELHTRLAARHIPLYAVASDEDLLPLAASLHAHTVITDEAYTEAEIRQDNLLWHNFDRAGIALQHANDRGILAKAPLMDANGLPYTDFAVYKQAWLQAYSGQRPSETELPVQTGQNLPLFPAHTGAVLPAYQQGGETAALTQWHAFKQNLVHYPITQNFPARKNTSILNAYLSSGCISPRLLAAESLANRHFEWLDKLIFRDYCYQLAYHRRLPETTDAAPVREYWRNGQTGVPIIDASIRSLEATGHLHPVLQQLCAHYFCHALNLDPNQGIAWTASVQTGTDPALNQANWHLAAQDTATVRYAHRSHQIDPDGSYIRSYLPELAHLPSTLIHTPWAAADDIDTHGYPFPKAV